MRKKLTRERNFKFWFDDASVAQVVFELKRAQRHLRYLAGRATNTRMTSQIVLTEAHIDEAITVLGMPPAEPCVQDACFDSPKTGEGVGITRPWLSSFPVRAAGSEI